MVSYNRSSSSDLSYSHRFYDLFFFNGSSIYECARLNQDLRFILNYKSAIQTFAQYRYQPGTLIFLYQAPNEDLQRFRSTFYYEPCLKVQFDALSNPQIIAMLHSSRCQKGIIECNEFIQTSPTIQLDEIISLEQLNNYQPKQTHGRLLLYDIEKNNEIIRERYSTPFYGNVKSLEQPHCPIPVENSIKCISPNPSLVKDSHSCLDMNDANEKLEADEFSKFMRQILDSPMSNPENLTKAERKTNSSNHRYVIQVDEEKSQTAQDITPQIVIPNRKPITEKGEQTKPGPGKIHSAKHRSKMNNRDIAPVKSQHLATILPGSQQPHSDYIHIFERLFRSFRQQVFDSFGDKCEEIITHAEQKVRFLSPEFDCHELKDDTVLSMLDLIETVIQEASLFKRSKLRQAAITLISDLYNKQYELLEQHRAIDKVEQTYYRLKK